MTRFRSEASGLPVEDAPRAGWIFDRIEEWASASPQRPAFILDNNDQLETYGYGDVHRIAARVAISLIHHGIVAGDRIAILMENVPQWVFVLLGVMRCGAITVPLSTLLPEAQALRLAKHAGCKMLFCDAAGLEKSMRLAEHLGAKVVTTGGEAPGAIAWSEFQQVEKPEALPEPQGDATSLLIYTSGTTGEPKGVQLTMLNLIHEVRGILEGFSFSAEHRILSVLPFSHVLPLIANALGPISAGACVVFLSPISPQRIVNAFSRHRISCFVCVPQFFYLLHRQIFSKIAEQAWLQRRLFGAVKLLARWLPKQEWRRALFSRIHRSVGPELRLFASGGSSFDATVIRDLTDLGYTTLNAYGLTETSAAVTATPVNHNRIGTVGRPLRGVTIRIDSPNAQGIGEVCIRGVMVMKGYFRDFHATADAVRDGWFYSGDLGRLDSRGNLTITGRSKDVIVLANGKNVYPEEVEAHFEQSPYIKETCVLGLTASGDGLAGPTLHAVVVPDLDEFKRRGQAGIVELIRFEVENLSKKLPPYQRVLSWSLRNEPLPRTVTRKLKRFEIHAEPAPESVEPQVLEDEVRFRSGTGAIVAALLRKFKPQARGLTSNLNLELDLAIDSLTRVDLLGELEAKTGSHIDDTEAAKIFTLGELLDALERHAGTRESPAKGWGEVLLKSPDTNRVRYIFESKPLSTAIIYTLSRLLRVIGRWFFKLRVRGLQNIPRHAPFILCPNHESFFDAPMMYAVLPWRVIANNFSLGYSDYWGGALSRRIAEACNIVPIDPAANLVRAMQAGALGLKAKKILTMFPEGTRSVDGHLMEFKKGAAILSFELGVPIVPVGINGTFEAWPRTGGIHLYPIEIAFGESVFPEQFIGSADPYSDIIKTVRDRIAAMTGDNRQQSEPGRRP